MRKLPLHVSILIILALFTASTQAQQIYVWEDSQGRKHYTDIAPDNSASNDTNTGQLYIPPVSSNNNQNIKYETKMPSSAFLLDSTDEIKLKQKQQKEKTLQAAEEARKKEESEKIRLAKEYKQQSCLVAQQNLATLNDYMEGEFSEIQAQDEEGNPITLDQSEIIDLHQKTLEEVKYFCED